MAHKQVLFRSEAREKILRGASALADAVRVPVSVARVLLLTEATLTELPEPKEHGGTSMPSGME